MHQHLTVTLARVMMFNATFNNTSVILYPEKTIGTNLHVLNFSRVNDRLSHEHDEQKHKEYTYFHVHKRL